MKNGGEISSSSTGTSVLAGNAGAITIEGVTGTGSSASSVSLDNSTISTTIAGGTSSSIPATIDITAQTVNLANGPQISAETHGAAPAGNIALNVGTLTTAGFPTIISSSSFLEHSEAGNAGTITIQGINGSGTPAANVSLDNSTISTAIFGGSAANTAASIDITAQTLALANGTSIEAETAGAAPAGDIVLHGGTLTSDSSTISTRSISMDRDTAGNAGDITLVSATDLTLKGSTISTTAAQATGGNIKLTVPNLIRLVDSTITSSVQGQAGSNGGNINIDPQWVVIQNSQILANANAGAGGNITITATGVVLVDPNSRIDASAGPAGISGSVNINSPIQVLGGILVPLNLAYSQASLSGDRCAADPTGQFSSFVQTGRDGVPQVPGALSPSPLTFLENLTSSSLGLPEPNWAAARLGLDFVRVDDSTRFRFHSVCRS